MESVPDPYRDEEIKLYCSFLLHHIKHKKTQINLTREKCLEKDTFHHGVNYYRIIKCVFWITLIPWIP